MADLHLVMAPARPKELGRFVSGQPSGAWKTLGWQKNPNNALDERKSMQKLAANGRMH
jgi:hypothetical protein